ncbi:MAG: nucleotide-binding protein [Dehalococcoidia bacterium]|nr:nucleotide-binding protein [Dehalococcoidia bacterium]
MSDEAADAATVIQLLREKLKEFDENPDVKQFSGGTFRAFATSVDSILARGLGSGGMRLRTAWHIAASNLPWPNTMITLGAQVTYLEAMFEARLPEVRGTLEAIISELETFGAPDMHQETQPSPPIRPRVFIAHGGESEALNKLCNFLDELGLKSLVVERLPSEGRSVNGNVEHYLDMADCAVVLATGDDVVDGKLQPRANVHIEIGRFQERFPHRIIYLLEEGAAFPSNVSEKVWERFSDSNMEKAIVKVVREVRAFGLLGGSTL